MTVSPEEVLEFTRALKEMSKYDLTDYSEKSITRRIEKVVTDNNMTVSLILKKMRNDENFMEKILKNITVNTTELFRDPKIWHTLRYSILPKYKNKNEVSFWHAGCSSGQEVYSMLILLNELEMFDKANVIGTDINSDILKEAEQGTYKYRFNLEYLDNFNKVIRDNPFNIEEYKDIPYSKYMDINKTNDKITMLPFLLKKPKYFKHDLVKDGNIFNKKFDFIICRNVLIYFNTRLQDKVFEMFYNSLKDDGHLIIGMHESMMGHMSEKFYKNGTIYQKK